MKETFLSWDCTRPVSDPLYRPPTPTEIKAVLDFTDWKQVKAAQLVGVGYERGGSQTIRRWRKGEREIPYSAWRLILILSGIISLGGPNSENI